MIEMHSALGHCQDPECLQSTVNHELVRLFRCSIHCDRNVCLIHLNAHNILYEEEKKQNNIIINELQDALTLYQSLFEQHMITYREIVRQASNLLLRNASSLVPLDQIRPVLQTMRQAIGHYEQDIIVIKCEPTVNNSTETEIEKNKNALNAIENTDNANTSTAAENGCQNFIVRIPRFDQNNSADSLVSTENDSQEEDEGATLRSPKRGNDTPRTRSKSIKRLQK